MPVPLTCFGLIVVGCLLISNDPQHDATGKFYLNSAISPACPAGKDNRRLRR